MLSLADLPAELLVYVANDVHPGDLVNFALTSKGMHAVSINALNDRHEHLKHHSRFELTTSEDGKYNGVELLQNCLRWPRYAYYIRDMTVKDCPSSWTNQVTQEVIEQFKAAISSLDSPTYGPPVQHRAGSMIVFVLLWCLQHLKILHIGDIDDIESCRLAFLLLNYITYRQHNGILSELEMVSMDSNDRLNSYDAAAHLQLFFALPSLKTIVAGRLNHTERPGFPWYKNSNVCHISLSCNQVRRSEQAWLSTLIAAPRTLEEFAFRWPTGRMFHTDLVIGLLKSHSEHTLKRLTIRRGTLPSAPLGNLHQFKALEYLDTDFSLLLDNMDIHQARAQRMLPHSIEHLRLHEDYDVIPDEIAGALCDLISFKSAAFPKLSKVDAFLDSSLLEDGRECNEDCTYEIANVIAGECMTQNIEFNVEHREQPYLQA